MKESKLDKLQKLNTFVRKSKLQQQGISTLAPTKTVLMPISPKQLPNYMTEKPRNQANSFCTEFNPYIVLLGVDNNARVPKFIVEEKKFINGKNKQVQVYTSNPITITQILCTPNYWFTDHQAMQEKFQLGKIKSNQPCVLSLKRLKSNFLNGNYHK